jgi:hypothetical protein
VSKGSTPRRCQVSREDYERRWVGVFGFPRPKWEMLRGHETVDVVWDRGERTYQIAEPDATGHP